MDIAAKNKLVALLGISVLITGCAGTANNTQPATTSASSAATGVSSVSLADIFGNRPGYAAKNFNIDALGPDVKDAIVRANLPPVTFNKIVVHTRDLFTLSSQGTTMTYNNELTYERAEDGLVRRMEVVQNNGFDFLTRFDLTYRGYFVFKTQSMTANATAVPLWTETRKVLRLDTNMGGHMNFTFLFGLAGKATSRDPAQFVCDSGKTYDASILNPAIEGQALELNCQDINSNGVNTDRVTFAYLEKYGIAIPQNVVNPASTIKSTIVDFRVQ
jgi:hypothetical protein